MKTCELPSTDENILQTFLDDRIKRDINILRFISCLNSINERFSIALDGQWGSGKTFFVKQTAVVLNAFNDLFTPQNKEDTQKVKDWVQKLQRANKIELKWKPQVCVYYDAWKNDNDNDPILSLVYTILQSTKEDKLDQKNEKLKTARKIIVSIAKSIAKQVSVRVAGINVTEIYNDTKEAITDHDPLASLEVEKELEESVAKFLDSLIDPSSRLVVFIDELDRCKPTYAVKLLERIKHYFSNDKITFVFSTNLGELQHTIKNFYGDEFNAIGYLEKFFDLTMTLPSVDKDVLQGQLGLEDIEREYRQVCSAVIEANNFTLRDAKKFAFFVKVAVSNNTRWYCERDGGKAYRFCLFYVAPIMIGLKMKDLTLFDEFVNGENSNPLKDVLNVPNILHSASDYVLSTGESWTKTGETEGLTVENRIQEVYDALFKRTGTVIVGRMAFHDNVREDLKRSVSLLSELSDFNI